VIQPWHESWRADPGARRLADRHYNRQKVGAKQFVPPGRDLVLVTADYDALWITSWPFAEYVKHAWAGAWVNSCFRNESSARASELIVAAVAATRAKFGEPPEIGMVTFVDASKIKPTRQPGRCYLKAGFRFVGHTQGGLVALQLLPSDMPTAVSAVRQQELFA
jgi:hypothetical protein